ncbi:DUF928 domain-containing protein [Planktothrix agardhii]|uniref:DUF928 domain-containing protein n=1 Tax=Planktothrix agardhii TaxID=1160 RepID=UPI00040EA8F4|nr:DUF928 domain-containing protein [Planktothrix agardhii]CAD0231005.1 conserved hypothetical protein [Planktothrix agardhii]CAD5960275.1 hypothetical protein NO758_03098 [Planktothrix agardhii]
MAMPMFFLHRATLGLTLLLQIVVANSLIVTAAHSASLPQNRGDEQNQVNFGDRERVQQPEQPGQSSDSPFTNWNAFTPPERGVPGRREGGGTRGIGCPSSMTALIPESTMGRTASGQPAFFLYISGTVDQKILEFEIADEGDKTLYKTTFPISTDRPGIVGIQWSENAKSVTLQDNKNYRWYIALKCNSSDASNDLLVSGWINSVALSPNQKLELGQTTDPLERLKIYANQGLWHETISTLATLKLNDSENSSLNNQWNDLLKSIGFDPDQKQTQIDKEKAQSILDAPILKIQTN